MNLNKEHSEKIIKEFPGFFKHIEDLRTSLMAFGFECGDGWYELIYDLCKDIKEEYDKSPTHVQETFYVVQVKEKFAGLRFYTSHLMNKKVDELITKAEQDSYRICESCGREGFLHTTNPDGGHGWYRTLCGECAKEEEYYKYVH